MIYAPATALARQAGLGVILGTCASAARDVMSWLGLGLLDLVRGRRFEPADGVWQLLGARCSGGISRWIQNNSGLLKDFSAALR